MKNIIRLISVLFLCGVLFNSARAQSQQKIDSLLNVLKTAKEDTGKVNTLNALSKQNSQTGDYEKAKEYASNALQLSEKIIYKKGKAHAYDNIGNIYWNQGNYDEALKNYFVALKIGEEISDKARIASVYRGIGIVYWNQGNYHDALKNFFASLKIFKEIGEKSGIGGCYINIGAVYSEQGDYPASLENYLNALTIMKETGDKRGIAMCYNNIGQIYDEQGNYTEALDNFASSLKIAQETGNKKSIANNYNSMGHTYYYQENDSQALKYFTASLKIREEIGDQVGIRISYNNIALIYMRQNKFTEALKYHFASLKISKEIGDQTGMASSFLNLGNLYTKLGKNQEARNYLSDALSLSKQIGYMDDIKYSYLGLSQLDSAVGNYKQSLENFKLFTVYKDSLLNEAGSKQINEMKVKYESEKKDKEIIILNKDKEIQNIEIKKQKLLKNSFIFGLVLMLILSFFIYNNFRTANKLKLQNIRNKIASDLHDDVGSTLNSISVYSEVAKQKSPAVVDELEHIGDASRKIIEVMSDIVWTINPKNDTFENIISRMSALAYNLLKAKNIEHTFKADESLNETKLSLESRRNFYLIFKEALNNLVKYSNATRASISLTGENGLVKLSVRDNGVGFDIAQTSKGNGLLNMKNRAKEMNAQLKIESDKGNGTSIELILKV